MAELESTVQQVSGDNTQEPSETLTEREKTLTQMLLRYTANNSPSLCLTYRRVYLVSSHLRCYTVFTLTESVLLLPTEYTLQIRVTSCPLTKNRVQHWDRAIYRVLHSQGWGSGAADAPATLWGDADGQYRGRQGQEGWYPCCLQSELTGINVCVVYLHFFVS